MNDQDRSARDGHHYFEERAKQLEGQLIGTMNPSAGHPAATTDDDRLGGRVAALEDRLADLERRLVELERGHTEG